MEAFANMAIDKGKNILNMPDNLNTLETKLKRLSFRKADFKEQVKKAEQTGKKKRKREVENWFEEVEQTEDEINALKNKIQDGGLLRNISSGDSVAKLVAKVEQLLEHSESQHFAGLFIDDHEYRGEPLVTKKLFGDKFQEGLETIWNWLLTDNLSNIGIYGQGGVGKTTLAKHIHNRLLEEKKDFNVYWVTVSQESSIKKLQDDIAKRVNLDLSGEHDEALRAARLYRSLAHQQSVLILDDVWDEFCLEKIGIAHDASKCRLILTTRSLEVCHRMLCEREFNVTTLDADETWNLFEHTLGLKRKLTAEVEETAKKVANRCAGLPLGIVTVAGSMRGVFDISEWRNVFEKLESSSIRYKEMEDKVFPILEWSFNCLDEWERPCFLYCCLYPEDWDIEREELINLFILAELIPRSKNRQLEYDDGRSILNKLVKACLLEETHDFSKRECIKMHDLIRDMALRITGRKSKRDMDRDVPRFLVRSIEAKSNVILEQNEWTQDLNAVSFVQTFYNDHGSIEIPPEMSPNCQNLSTLIFENVKIERIPNSFFSHMNGLKVLNLRHCNRLKELPNSVSNLVNLTALLLGGCTEIKSVPPLGKLKKLRELDLYHTNMDDIPQGLELLFKLEHLNLMGCSYLKELPNSVSNLANLTALLLGGCSKLESVPPLGKLQKLRELDFSYTNMDDITQGLELLFKLEHLHMNSMRLEKKIIPKGTFSKLQRLQHLVLPMDVHICDPQVLKQLKVFQGRLSWMEVYNEFMTSGCWPKHYAITVVEEEDTPLRFDYYTFDYNNNCKKSLNFEWLSQKGLDVDLIPEDITELRLSKCFRLSDGNLHNLIRRSKDLVILVIRHSEEVEFLLNFSSPSPSPSHVDDDEHQLVVLPNLKKLLLYNLPNLVGLINWGRQQQQQLLAVGTFSSLTGLTIDGCHRLKKLFTVQLLSHQHTLQNLHSLDIRDCEQVEEMIAANDNDEGMGEEIVIHPSSSSSTLRLPKLQHLTLINLPQLENKNCKAISIISDSMREIWVVDCPKLKGLPLFIPTNGGNGQTSSSSAPPPNTLPWIKGWWIKGSKEWWESLEWDHYPPNSKAALLPFFVPR